MCCPSRLCNVLFFTKGLSFNGIYFTISLQFKLCVLVEICSIIPKIIETCSHEFSFMTFNIFLFIELALIFPITYCELCTSLYLGTGRRLRQAIMVECLLELMDISLYVQKKKIET